MTTNDAGMLRRAYRGGAARIDGRLRSARQLKALFAELREAYPSAGIEETRRAAMMLVAAELLRLRVLQGYTQHVQGLVRLESLADRALRRLSRASISDRTAAVSSASREVLGASGVAARHTHRDNSERHGASARD